MTQKYENTKKELDKVVSKYSRLIECLENWNEYYELDDSLVDDSYVRELLRKIERHYDVEAYVQKETNSPIIVSTGNTLVDSYIKATKRDVKYGWLDPTGKFYEVDFGDHQSWCYHCICDTHERPDKKLKDMQYSKTVDLSRYYDELIQWCKDNKHYDPITCSADFLVYKKWVLIHSPSMGIPSLSTDEKDRLTKAQKEFLFDYYMGIDEPRRASELYEDNE